MTSTPLTPLVLVAGFLGAGKTTFLRALLPALARHQLRARVVLNDYADARIDAATLADLVPDLVALSGSCVCCESLEDLMATLARLGHDRAGAQEVVIVEANGGTEAGELLATLAGAPELRHLAPPLQLTVIDAKRFGTRGWQNEMEREQLLTATHVALGRLDLVSAARADEVRAAVTALVPQSTFTTPDDFAAVLALLETSARAPVPQPHDHDHEHHPFAAFAVDLPAAVDGEAFLGFLRTLPPQVLRAKGIVALADPPGEKRSFQKVDEEAEISPCQLADPEGEVPRAIFVGPQLPRALIEARLAALAPPR
jgi:G3E family GTPase